MVPLPIAAKRAPPPPPRHLNAASLHPARGGIDESFSSLLDALRWISAGLVMMSHIRALSLVQGAELAHPNLLIRGLYAATSTGVEAVAVFFVLSGFLVGGINSDRSARGTFDLRLYAIDRTTRIYTVLVPVLASVAIVDTIGRVWLHRSLYYDGGSLLIAERFGAFSMPTLATFFGNLGALQDFYVSTFGSDIPLWSLSYEIWFHVLAVFTFTLFLPAASAGLHRCLPSWRSSRCWAQNSCSFWRCGSWGSPPTAYRSTAGIHQACCAGRSLSRCRSRW